MPHDPVLSVDIGATRARVGLVDLTAFALRWKTEFRLDEDPGRTAAALLAAVRESRRPPQALGVAAAPEFGGDGLVRRWPNRPSYVGADLLGPLRGAGYRPIVLDDGMAGAIASSRDAGTGSACAYIVIGTGIGGGVVIGGTPLTGVRGRAMDVGHLKVPSAGQSPCGCGQAGCLQTVASGRALTARCDALGIAIDGLSDAASHGNREAAAVLDTQVAALTEAIQQIVALFDPERITIAGGYAHYDHVVAAVRARLPEDIQPRLVRDTLGDDGPLLGAALHANRAAADERSLKPASS